jgi:decaprenyl-phosphate phosphoribosyltransferase
MGKIFIILRAIRVKQWNKNLLVFAPAIFAFSFTTETLKNSFLTFLFFCFLSSGFYLFNDVKDVNDDRNHPLKSKRPIASGQMSIASAVFLGTIFIAGVLTAAFFMNQRVFITLMLYAILQLFYNWFLKHTPIVDVMAISAGFLLRILAGFMATDLYFSKWLVLCGGLASMLVAIDKRKTELFKSKDDSSANTRKVLKFYSEELLTTMQGSMITSCIICYSLWASGPQLNGATTPYMMLSIPFVMYGLFRYKFLGNYHNSDVLKTLTKERPEDILIKDRGIIITVIGWLLCVLLINYLKMHNLIN